MAVDDKSMVYWQLMIKVCFNGSRW